MGLIFITTIGLFAGWLLVRLFRESDSVHVGPRLVVGVIAAFAGAWFVGSAFQRKPFLASSPDPVTLLGAFAGALLGAYLIGLRQRQRD
ncbi:hypothetical protein [Sphingomonas sp. ID0503]|jgi:uncharacterized membrane protein YeaQ/YmgE (transglycosylase-associated protein family)|uniref:hypothetical protein n=1 Tax=Sphingomonas sp. ID0503 TaxID=3399691 RepID=UPI003AFA8B84